MNYKLFLPLAMYGASSLDNAYAAAIAAKDYKYADIVAAEIVARLSSVSGFVSGYLGLDSYPNYSKATGFKQSETARASVSVAADNVTDSLKIGGTAALIIAAGLAVLWVMKK